LTRQVPVSRVPGQCISFAVRHYVAGVAWEQSPAFEFVGPLTYHSGIIVGYAWLFPMRDSVANVGVGHLGSGASYASLTELLERFTQKLLRDDRRFASERGRHRPRRPGCF
jgi:flavin-dependent dehydrogenase